MSSLTDEYIILASNVKSFNDTNTIANFKTKLARRREFLASDDWRVGVSEITYKQSWYNIKENTQITYMNEMGYVEDFGGKNTETQSITAGYYSSIPELISTITYALDKLLEIGAKPPELQFDPNNQIVTLIPGNVTFEGKKIQFIPVLGTQIENILGLIDKEGRTLAERLELMAFEELNIKYDAKTTTLVVSKSGAKTELRNMLNNMRIEAEYPADINGGFDNLYIYSNIVQQSDVGDAFAPILSTVPIHTNRWGKTVHHEPKNLIYRPLQSRIFDTIEIDIRDDSGHSVPFKLGNIILKLHFLKYG